MQIQSRPIRTAISAMVGASRVIQSPNVCSPFFSFCLSICPAPIATLMRSPFFYHDNLKSGFNFSTAPHEERSSPVLAPYSRNLLEMCLVPRNRPVDAVDDVFRLAETVTFARVAEHDGLDARVLQRDVELLALCNRNVVVVLAVNEERRRLHLRRIAQR